ncbi:anoctamin-8-like [Sycon ciliatum]|uniref:anoctamin-8-like n=1 Tax=Sycon ciliatum TaxID=27933 RepID=UPI0031F5F570
MSTSDFVETSYCLVFSNDKLRANIDTLLDRKGWRKEWEEYQGKLYLTVTAPFDLLAEEAERVKLEKKLNTQANSMARFHFSKFTHYRGYKNKMTFFSPAEQARLIWSALEDTPYSKNDFGRGVLPKFNDQFPFCTAMKSAPAFGLEDSYPLHSPWGKRRFNSNVSFRLVNLDHAVRDYFGEEVAFYFVWMLFFAKWLLIPGVLGLALYLFRPEGVTVDNSPYIPLYSLCVPIWGVFFVKFWKRHMNAVAFEWNAHDFEEEEELRPEFWGEKRISPVTGKIEVFFPEWKRYTRYFVSFLVMLPMLGIALGAMCLSLNLNNYIRDEESPLYIGTLAVFAQPGGIFAGDSPYYGYLVPTIAHSVVISILNTVYRSIAFRSTNFENHRTVEEWEKSFIVKRVIFEAFDCYLALFYIAFYRFDVVALRNELVGLFWGDELRRVGVEVIMPLLTMMFQRKRTTRKMRAEKKASNEKPIELSQAVLDAPLEEYDSFDDYLEMVIQFGYITLFASAFPLCSIISVGFVLVETMTDSLKLLYLYRRPRSRRAGGIGVWYSVMYFMVIASILTNCFILGFSSEQLMQWMPNMFKHEGGDQQFKLGYGRYVVGMVFTLEHILILLALVIEHFIPSCPRSVTTEMARRKHLAKQWLAEHEADASQQKTVQKTEHVE